MTTKKQLLGVVIGALAMTACGSSPEAPPPTPSPAPGYTVTSCTVDPIRLADQKSGWIVNFAYTGTIDPTPSSRNGLVAGFLPAASNRLPLGKDQSYSSIVQDSYSSAQSGSEGTGEVLVEGNIIQYHSFTNVASGHYVIGPSRTVNFSGPGEIWVGLGAGQCKVGVTE